MPRSEDFLNGNVTYGLDGSQYISLNDGGGSALPAIVPNQIGGLNGDLSLIINVKTNVDGASVLINGENQFIETPTQIQKLLSDVLLNSNKVITVEKNGYTTNEKYIINAVKNSQYFNGNYAPFGQAGTVPIQDLYSDTTPYVFHIQYFVNGIKQPFSFDHSSQVVTLEFNNLVATNNGPIVITPTPETQTYTLTITSDNDLYAEVIQNTNNITILKSGVNTITGNVGDSFRISSSDLLNYRIVAISGTSTFGTFDSLNANGNDSLSTLINLNGNYNLSITTEKVTSTIITVPTLTLNNENIGRTYNINNKSGILIGFTTTGNVTKVTAYVNNTPYTFTNLPDPTNAGIVIPASAFTTIGNYKIILVPTNLQEDGTPVNLTYSVVDDVYVGIPDITNIKYPSQIIGPDYVGTDVSFDLNYTTVNTDFVNAYIGKGSSFFKLNSNGSNKMNVGSILNLSNGDYTENDTTISFQLRLVPHNISGYEEITGKEEVITIKFLKGKLTIPRAVAINRILEAFESQFDDITSNTSDDTSKYLTHLVHLGNGNNKVITTWTGSNNSLILKLYEPLDTTVQPNQQVWISKLQSNPIIDTLNLVGVSEQFCPPLKGPNFSLESDNGIGYKVYDDLLASGSVTSTDLLNKYLKTNNIDTTNLNIQYVSGSTYIFENFSNFGSAEERANNFIYKLQLIENYKAKYQSLTTGTAWVNSTPVSNDAIKALDYSNEIIRGFDGFENFLYKSSDDLAYPKINGIPVLTTSVEAQSWYSYLIETANEYDVYNVNYLVNNIPQFIKEDYNNNDFIIFLDMIGQHFDIIWCYIKALSKNKILEDKQANGISNQMIHKMLESFGWEGRLAFDSQFLWEYAFGTYKDGIQKYGMPLKDANDEVWRRILNNLPYLLKNKGTARAMKAIMACYGVPQSMLTIMEFGGPQDPTQGGITKFTYDDRTAALVMKQSSSLSIPWHIVSPTSNYPESIEFRIKPSSYGTYSLISGSNFGINLIQTTGSFARLDIDLGMGTGSAYSYFLEPFLSGSPVTSSYYMDQSIYYVSDADVVTGSLEFPVSLDYYSSVLINRHDLGGNSSWYEINYSTTDGHRILTYASMSIMATTDIWESGSFATVGGNGFVGNIDEFRLWRVPLEISKFKNHSLFPDAINGNSYTASTADLLYRLDFEYPKDRTLDNNIKNVSISTQYGEDYGYAQNFYSASSYPYQYQPYDRTITADVPSVGFGYGNKIRFEDIELVSDLSYKVRATKKSFDRAPIDSSRLGLFLSPTKELNMDILKAFGDFNIDNYIGDPGDEYKEQYSELKDLREYYFERLDRNINEYIQLIKYIDKSLFDVLHDVAPARAKVSKGLLIEPHFLERNKTRWDKPTTEYNDIEADITANETYLVESDIIGEDALLDATEVATFDFEYNNIEGNIIADETYYLEGTTPMYDGVIDYGFSGSLEGSYPTYEANIQAPTGSSITAEIDAFAMTMVGMDANSLDIAGFGLYARNGVGIQKTIDLHGNISSSRVVIDLVKKQYTQNISTQISGYPKIGAQPGDQVVYEDIAVTKYKYEVTILPFSASNGTFYQPSVGGTTISVTPLNGYYSTHYKFKNTLTEGLQRSFHKGSTQDATTTPDGLDPIQTFTTNPNILRVAKTGRGSGEPILEVD
jgi:hypothetical protein